MKLVLSKSETLTLSMSSRRNLRFWNEHRKNLPMGETRAFCRGEIKNLVGIIRAVEGRRK